MSAYLRVTMVGLALCLLLGAMHQLGPCDARTEPLADTISLVADPSPGPAARYGLKKTKAALQAKGVTVQEAATVEAARGSVVIVAGLGKGSAPAAGLLRSLSIAPPEGAEPLLIQQVRTDGKECLLVSGGDDRGLMYALLDVADRISWAKAAKPLSEIRDVREKPAVAERALSIYVMQQADFERRLFNEDYWDRYLDVLARNRFNSFVLIFGYENAGYLAPPYPYFFDIEAFPEVQTIGLSREQQRRNLKALNRLIEMAHEHGLRFTAGIWDHIYRGGVQAGGVQGAEPGKPRPGTVAGLTEKNLMACSRAALARFLKEVPALDAVQFRMHDESGLKPGAEMRAFWADLFKTIKDSGRNLRFDLRAKGLPDDVIDLAVESGINFRITTKYWAEQMGLPFHPTHVNRQNQFDRRHGYADLLRYPQKYKMHWRLWNGGTARILLWGDPEYARRFAASTHLYDGEGFEVNEPLATKMASHPHDQKPFDLLRPAYRYYDYEFERYWHFFQVFGRIGYNPDTPPEVWRHEFERRFGKEAAPFLERGLHRASQVLPRIITAIFPYNRFPTTRGWVEKQRWEDLPAYSRAEPSDVQQFLGMDEAARLRLEGGESAKVHPERTSEWFARTAADVLNAVAQAEQHAGRQPNKEFVSTTTDLKILANLALYHSRRIHAGLGYALFRRSRDLHPLDDAIRHEKHAIEAWEKLVEAAGDVYNDDLMMGLPSAGLSGHWKDELASLKKGLAALESERKAFRPALVETGPSIAHVPARRAAPSKVVVIRATVGSADAKPVVRVAYRADGHEWRFVRMEQSEPSLFRAAIPASDVAEGLHYYVEATDATGRKATYPRGGESQALAVTVTNDNTPPAVTHTPITTADAGKPLTITARVRDPSGVRWVRVLYRSVNQFKDYQSLAMKPTDAENEFQAIIPGEHVAAGWDFTYLIEVMDSKGNGKIYPDLEKETPYVIVRLRQPDKDKLPAPGTTGNPDNVPFIGKRDPQGNPVRLAKATGHVSNYSEDKVAPYVLPDPLVTSDKRRATTAETWRKQRRPEILKFFRDEIYGAVPENAPRVAWEVTETDANARKGTAIMRRIVGRMGDKKQGPRMSLTVFTPAKAKGPVPVLLHLTFAAGAGGRPPGGFDLVEETLSRGWGYAALGYTDVQPDRPDRWTEGVIGLTLKEGQTKPAANEWGTISAWAWGLSRTIDYFETDPSVNAKQIAITGASRLGKTVLWASAQDERVAAVFAAVPGEMGASLIRRDWGETLDDMAERFGYQFAGNLQRWVGKWKDLAVDQHMLIALSAPRPVFVSGGIKDQWSDPKGQFLALVAAGPVYRLLGAKDLGVTEMPALDKPVAAGSLAYHYHSSGHVVLPADWKIFYDFAARHYKATTKKQPDGGPSK